MEVFGLSYW